MLREAFILAGGRGTRFKPYTEIIPKPMVPLGPEEKPVIENIITWLKMGGVNRFVLLCGYKWRYIQNYLGTGQKLGVEIEYSLDDEVYSGSGGAVLKAFKNGLSKTGSPIIWYGDIIAPLNPQNLVREHERSRADATVVVTEKYKVPVGVAKVDEKKNIIALREKPWLDIHATIGILVIKKDPVLEAENVLGKKFDIMGDLIPWMVRNDYKVKAYIFKEKWYDVGSLEKYVKVNDEIKWSLFQTNKTG